MRLLMISVLTFSTAVIQTGTAPAYDARFVLANATFTGTATFSVNRKGEVAGTMKLTDPQTVEATLGGVVKGDTWTFEFPYSLPDRGCTGTVKGSGAVSADRTTVKGEVLIGGACVEAPESAAFTFTRRPAGK